MLLKASTFDLKQYLSAPVNDINASTPRDFEAGIVDLFYGTGKDAGARLPWKKTHSLIAFRGGEVTAWAGANGHGKSQATTQVALDMAAQGEKVVIGSFEMAPERTMHRMVRQAGRTDCPSIQYIKGFLSWADGKLWLLNRRGMVNADYIVAAARYCREKLGVTQFFVDNLMKCVAGEDDMNGQKDFIEKMCSVALDTGLHIHVICHIRKGMSEFDVPTKWDVKGSGSITDQVDNVIMVFRNKRKEYAVQSNSADQKTREMYDALLNVDKQRNGHWEGKISLWYHPHSMSYAEDNIQQPKRYDITPNHAALI